MIPLNRVKNNGKVDLWDLGPQVAPKAPPPPAEPDKAKLKGHELAAAELEYEDACEIYKQKLREFTTAKRIYFETQEQNGGPIKVELWGVDARHALEREPDRYKLDLPRGIKAGRAQVEAEQQAEAEADAMSRTRASDPQFGGQASP